MRALLAHLGISLRLNLRNPMAMVYGFAFPLIFLLAFLALYRADRVPLLGHMGELLTVTALGGACFGLPTTMVSERERGVWRRYRLTPTPAGIFVVSTLVVRYVLLLAAALIQLVLAWLIGMPAPADPLALFLAFSCASIAFLGLGLVIAMLADNVPAVQALGQCIFLPMLMIGGVAVPVARLPDWAQKLSTFFPGRYAVEAIQASVTGPAVMAGWFPLVALLLIGAAGGLAATLMFRWDAGPAPRGQRKWLVVAIGMWVAVGSAAAWRAQAVPPLPVPVETSTGREYVAATPMPPPVRRNPPARPAPVASWRTVAPADFAGVAYDRLPPDSGIVAPIATVDEAPDPSYSDQLDQLRVKLADWPPGHVSDPVQRVRNLLYVAAAPDALQMTGFERFVPVLVYGQLRASVPREDLARLLYWVATHPNEGDDGAVRNLAELGLPDTPVPAATTRTRAMLYAFKLLGRTTGAVAQR